MLTYEEEEEIEGLLNLFDLDQFSDEDPLDAKTEKVEEFIENWEKEKEKKNKKIKSYESRSISISTNSNSENQEKHERINYVHNLDTKTLFKMVEILKKDKNLYNIYSIWFKICCSLYANAKHCNIPEEDIKNALIDFSKGWNVKRVAYAASFGTEFPEYTEKEKLIWNFMHYCC